MPKPTRNKRKKSTFAGITTRLNAWSEVFDFDNLGPVLLDRFPSAGRLWVLHIFYEHGLSY